MKSKVCLVLALAVLVICSTSAFAAVAPFSMTYAQESGSWVYELFNNDTTGDVIVTGLDIVWDPNPTPLYTVTGTPAGWVENISYPWPAWDAIGNDPGPGASLKGFSFIADTPAPSFTVYYNILGEDGWYNGDASEAVPTPEPSSMLALLGGVGTLGAMIRRRIA